MLRLLIIILLVAVHAVPAAAAPLSVRVVDARGRPVNDAVVTLRPIGVAARAPVPSGSYSVSQQNLQFHPFVLVVPVGANVSFPNRDATKHHVYSFSAAKRF
jgi:plastocyanin